jgi:hypothetical protein
MTNNHSRQSLFERYPIFITVCALTLVCLALDVGAALAYRWLNGYSLHDRAAEIRGRIESSYRTRSDIFHHALLPNKAVEGASWGPETYPFATNSLGLRDSHVRKIGLVSDKHRILFIGDSFTEGTGVRYEDSFVGRIARAYQKRDIEVLNAGVISYSPVIYWRKTKYLIEDVKLHFDEVVVFLDISDANDEAEHYTLDEKDNVIG